MKHEIIKIDNYLLVVDESEIKFDDWYIDDSNLLRPSVTSDKDYWSTRKDYKKVIAHLPLNGSPILEGVPLLPPFEIEDSNKDLFYQKQVMNPYPTGDQSYVSYEKGFIDGYNKAKEKYKYTEEDLRKAFLKGVSITGEGYNAEYAQGNDPDIECVFGEEADKFIQSLSQPKMPIGFEQEMNETFVDAFTYDRLRRFYGKKLKTTTTPEGHIQWVGTYIYEVK